ncbi:MAG: hypothetical protein ABI053_07840 [Lacisediminihabitans sp.]
MSTFRNPVGPQSNRVYWRRRMIVGLGILAVIVIIILIVSRPGAKDPATTTSASPAPASTASAPASTAKDSDACIPSKIKLEAVVDQTSYAAGVNPQISMKITNTGKTVCTMNLGSTQQELKITSGSETYWDSKDCQSDAVDTPTVLKPGDVLSTPAIAWDRTRSSTTTCGASRTPVTAGGASYHLSVRLGDIVSKDTAQFLLN